MLHVNVVLHSAWDEHIDLAACILEYAPWLLASEELSARELLCIRCADVLAGASELEQVVYLFLCADSVWIIDVSVWSGDCYALSAELPELPSCTPCNVTEAGDSNFLALEVFAVSFEHFLSVPYDTESCSFSSSEESAVRDSLTCENAFISVNDSLVLSEEISDLSCTNTEVTSRNVCVRSDVSVEPMCL